MLVYKYVRQQKAQSNLNFWPVCHTHTKETLWCKENFICPAPPPNFTIFPGLQIAGHAVVSWLVRLS